MNILERSQEKFPRHLDDRHDDVSLTRLRAYRIALVASLIVNAVLIGGIAVLVLVVFNPDGAISANLDMAHKLGALIKRRRGGGAARAPASPTSSTVRSS